MSFLVFLFWFFFFFDNILSFDDLFPPKFQTLVNFLKMFFIHLNYIKQDKYHIQIKNERGKLYSRFGIKIDRNIFSYRKIMLQSLSANDLMSLFKEDNIWSGESIDMLRSWGGVKGLEEKLCTNFRNGVSVNQAQMNLRVDKFGKNIPTIFTRKDKWEVIGNQLFQSFFFKTISCLLVLSLIISIVFQGPWTYHLAIFTIAFIMIGYICLKNRIIEQQHKFNHDRKVWVLRNSQWNILSEIELVVGDIVKVQAGQSLSADGILFEAYDLRVDQTSLTGDSSIQLKGVPITYQRQEKICPFLMSFSHILQGSGKMVIAGVGQKSVYGQIVKQIDLQFEQSTCFQEQLNNFQKKIYKILFILVGWILISIQVHYLVNLTQQENFIQCFLPFETLAWFREHIFELIMIFSVRSLINTGVFMSAIKAKVFWELKRNYIHIKDFEQFEKLAEITDFCLHDTSVLIENQLVVSNLFIGQRDYTSFDDSTLKQSLAEILSFSLIHNTHTHFSSEFPCDNNNGLKNKIEYSLINLASKLGYSYEKLKNPQKRHRVFHFSKNNKKNCTIYNLNVKIYAFVKGQPEFVLPYCTAYLDQFGRARQLTELTSTKIKEEIHYLSENGIKIYAVAYKQTTQVPQKWDQVEKNLIFIALVGMKYLVKQKVPESIERLKKMGIKCRIVSDLHMSKLISIGKDIGLLDKSQYFSDGDLSVIRRAQFRNLVENQSETLSNFMKIEKSTFLFAQMTENEKCLLVSGLKRLNNAVAVMGNHVSDVPALKTANVGVCLTDSTDMSTDMAKNSSGIVLQKNCFSSFIITIKQSRHLLNCTKEFILFKSNFLFLLLSFYLVGVMMEGKPTLQLIHLLFADLSMNFVSILFFFLKNPHPDILENKFIPLSKFLKDPSTWAIIILQTLLQLVFLIMLKGGLIIPDSENNFSFIFNLLMYFQIFNQLNFSAGRFQFAFEVLNKPLLLFFSISLLILSRIFAEKNLSLSPLSFKSHVLAIFCGSFSIFIAYLIKIILPSRVFFSTQGIQLGRFSFYWPHEKKHQ